MDKTPPELIRNLTDLCEIAKRFPPRAGKGWLYRGHACESWSLKPSVGRLPVYDTYSTGRERLKKPNDLILFDEWCSRAIAFCPNLPEKELERLAYAQHHGLRTRLLDWTFNPLVALFFAISDNVINMKKEEEQDGALFIHFCDLEAEHDASIASTLDIARYTPRPIHSRILAQGSVFTIHPEPDHEMNPARLEGTTAQFAGSETNLVKFRIKAIDKNPLRKALHEFGVDEIRLFPGVEGISKYLNERFNVSAWVNSVVSRANEPSRAQRKSNRKRTPSTPSLAPQTPCEDIPTAEQ